MRPRSIGGNSQQFRLLSAAMIVHIVALTTDRGIAARSTGLIRILRLSISAKIRFLQ
jgi:hypothetical protein